MELEQRILSHFETCSDTLARAAQVLCQPLAQTSRAMVECLLNEGKLLVCGNGASASLAQYFSARLMNRFERDRPGLPAICLTDASMLAASESTADYPQLSFKPIRALGNPGDILVLFRCHRNLLGGRDIVQAAHGRSMRIVALTAFEDTELGLDIAAGDLELRVPSSRVARVQEVQLLLAHTLCDLIDHQLFGGDHES